MLLMEKIRLENSLVIGRRQVSTSVEHVDKRYAAKEASVGRFELQFCDSCRSLKVSEAPRG